MNAPDTKRKTLLAILLALVLAVVAAFIVIGPGPLLSPTGPAPVSSSPLSPFAKGAVAGFLVKPQPAELPEVAFKDQTGAPRSLADFKGKVVLLNLWATWCAPCRAEMPAFNALQKEMGGENFEVVALSLDLKGIEVAKQFLAEVKADTLITYIDDSTKALNTLQAPGLPTTILIDRNGRELGRLLGPAEWNSPEAKALISAAIAANPSP